MLKSSTRKSLFKMLTKINLKCRNCDKRNNLKYFFIDLLHFNQNSVNLLIDHHIKDIVFETSTFLFYKTVFVCLISLA